MNDIDVWQNALKEINMNEAVQFVSRGKLIVETSQVEMYNKIQALLNCPELEYSHRFLYSLDPEELTEAEIAKVCNLYKLGQDRGFIEPDDAEVDVNVDASVEEPTPTQPTQAVQPAPKTVPTSAYTVLYSAMRNGNVVTGEAYSNAINPRSAKADAISQLQKAGYSNIAILAIECGDPDCCGAQTNNVVEQPLQTPAIPDYAAEDDEDVKEDDMLDGRKHNLHVDEQDVEEDDMLDNRHHNGHIDEAGEEDEESKDAQADEDPEEKAANAEDKEEQAEEPDEKLSSQDDDKKAAEDKPELDASKKAALKDSYKKAFKAAMLKCKFEDKKFEDLTLDEKVKFFTALSEAWGSKEDPSLFMSDKELDQLEKIVVKK